MVEVLILTRGGDPPVYGFGLGVTLRGVAKVVIYEKLGGLHSGGNMVRPNRWNEYARRIAWKAR